MLDFYSSRRFPLHPAVQLAHLLYIFYSFFNATQSFPFPRFPLKNQLCRDDETKGLLFMRWPPHHFDGYKTLRDPAQTLNCKSTWEMNSIDQPLLIPWPPGGHKTDKDVETFIGKIILSKHKTLMLAFFKYK